MEILRRRCRILTLSFANLVSPGESKRFEVFERLQLQLQHSGITDQDFADFGLLENLQRLYIPFFTSQR